MMLCRLRGSQEGGVKFSMKTLQHVGHASTKWTLNGVALKKEVVNKYGKQEFGIFFCQQGL